VRSGLVLDQARYRGAHQFVSQAVSALGERRTAHESERRVFIPREDENAASERILRTLARCYSAGGEAAARWPLQVVKTNRAPWEEHALGGDGPSTRAAGDL